MMRLVCEMPPFVLKWTIELRPEVASSSESNIKSEIHDDFASSSAVLGLLPYTHDESR